MYTTKITRTFALAGFAPAGKLSHLYRGLVPVLVLFAATAMALPAQTFTSLLSFDGTDGNIPVAGLVQAANGSLYGTTTGGGANACTYYQGVGCGTIFKITPSGTQTALYSFCSQSNCTDGETPTAGLVQAANGDFYGTTVSGGANNNAAVCYSLFSPATSCGTIFKITPNGTLTTLYSFCSQRGCADGAYPNGLVQAANGDLYGTNQNGGANSAGTVFKITPGGTLTTLYTFCSQSGCTEGAYPNGLVQAGSGDFYGTAYGGGVNNGGTVFKITPSGTLTTLYSFCAQSGCTDGEYPYAALVQATNGEFYGTTQFGGVNCADIGGCGTVFKITPSDALTTLYSFCSQDYPSCTDGYQPEAGIIQATDGNLYGTTPLGGAPSGGGTIFKITQSGTLTTVYSLCPVGYSCTEGAHPAAGLVQDTNGTFYGTTSGGGGAYTYDEGTVFSLSVGLGAFVETQTTAGEVGEVVKILGNDLTGATSVSFNGTPAVFKVSASSLITTTVPAGATSGEVQVVTPSRTLASNVPFRVLP